VRQHDEVDFLEIAPSHFGNYLVGRFEAKPAKHVYRLTLRVADKPS